MTCGRSSRLLAALIITLYCSSAVGGNYNNDKEIGHLLDFIENSGCSFTRNKTEYEAPEARKHILEKYQYAKRWINGAEEFIEYAATRSSISGEPYHVRCQEMEIPSNRWLHQELDRYRVASEPVR